MVALRFFLILTGMGALLLQAMVFWPCGRSQEPAGFLSIDCGGSHEASVDSATGITWISDTNLTNEGKAIVVVETAKVPRNTLRLFNGSQSKYCYSLTNSAVKVGASFMVRAIFFLGDTTPAPYTPKNGQSYEFKLIVDADEWADVSIPYRSALYWSYEVYVRAQRSSIDACLARNPPDGDAPFISSLELRPLPSTLTSTQLMTTSGSNQIFILIDRSYYGFPGGDIRYENDSLDRLWFPSYEKIIQKDIISTAESIDASKDVDRPPSVIFQSMETINGSWFSWTWHGLQSERTSNFVAEFYFAEIDPAVNASGQRMFNILMANGEQWNTGGPIDIFAQAGAYTAYSYAASFSPDTSGNITFRFTQSEASLFPPVLAGSELFHGRPSNVVTSTAIVTTTEAIKTSLELTSYTGDPCLPIGYGYSWLKCSTEASGITGLFLSNYSTGGGEIPRAINQLTNISEVYLDGNGLMGSIPNLSALENLETLDLKNNKLNGSIPSFLATLKNLKALYVQNNNLSGEIPSDLLHNKQLEFKYSGNPYLMCGNISEECGNLTSTNSKKISMGMVIGVTIVGILLVSIATVIATYYYCRKRLHHTNYHAQRELSRMDESALIPVVPDKSKFISKLPFCEYSFQEIRNATDNFHSHLGQGGFGRVCKGCLEDGRLVAIKVASSFSHQGLKEFLNEVSFLSRLHHRNLVGLLGFCQNEILALVYEFMPSGSLFDCLHASYSKAILLSWSTRLSIIVDAAQGLDYLHNGCKPRIIHRDVKSSNILLGDNMEAKLSDFGISREYLRDETGAPTTTLMGSMGYIDPEYLSTMKLTETVDVYSFGVLLFEVVCGRQVLWMDHSQQQIFLVNWAKEFIARGMIDEIVDDSLHGEYDASSVWKVLEVAFACVQMPSSRRPKMSEVCQGLQEAKQMECESHQLRSNPIDEEPSKEFMGTESNDDTLSYTNVSAR